VVATAVGGLPEVVSDGRNGFLAPSEDVQGLARRVVQLLEDPPLRRRLGQQGREEVGSRFSLDARVQALEEIYEEVLE
jgi:glycosyltransferase involved in cell wall biosynthesis